MVNPQTLFSGVLCLKTTTRRSASSNKSWALYVTAPSLIKLTHPPTSLFSMVTPSKVPTTTIVRYTARLFKENPTSYHPRTNYIIARRLYCEKNAHNKICHCIIIICYIIRDNLLCRCHSNLLRFEPVIEGLFSLLFLPHGSFKSLSFK